MNTLEEFLERQKDFHTNVKHKMLRDLNEKSNKYGVWKYEDGFFSLHDKEHNIVFILKGDFEPYVFNTLVALPSVSYPTEESVYSVDDVSLLIEDLIEQYNVEDQNGTHD